MITPADERIEMALDDLTVIQRDLFKITMKLQEEKNPVWKKLSKLRVKIDNTATLLEEGY